MTERSRRARYGVALRASLAAPVVWAAHFLVLNLGHVLICAQTSAPRPGLWLVFAGAVSLAAAALIGFFAMAGRSPGARAGTDPQDAFFRALVFGLATLSIVGVLWTALTVVLIRPCSA
ncbi:MAG: hypothetical protein IT536_02635 [Hyphomicrobiales bacterium]|nr:hypothetical protein [Hyphomicrobiales bacterium]